MHGFDEIDHDRAARALVELAADPLVGTRCVATARRHFSLHAGVRAYADIYASLAA
jgi:hypothetical protein